MNARTAKGSVKTIVWDVDDVLNDLTRAWFHSWSGKQPRCPLAYEELRENPPERLLGITRSDYLRDLDAFRTSPAYQSLQPLPEVLAWFEANGGRFHHLALTAVPLRAASASAQWVMAWFGRWIRSWSFVPSLRDGEELPRYDSSKADYLERLGSVDLFIDDSPENVASARKAGLTTLLFPRPWNSAPLSAAQALASIERLLAAGA